MGFLIMLKVNRSVAIVPRELAEMREVSLAAKGLYALLQMNDDIISIRVLADRYSIGHEFAEQCFEELLAAGYVDIIFGSEVVVVINQ